MKGSKGLQSMIAELLNSKNRELQFQAVKGVGVMGMCDDECLEVLVKTKQGAVIKRLGELVRSSNFLLQRAACHTLLSLCTKSVSVCELIKESGIMMATLKQFASSTKDSMAKEFAKKVMKKVKKMKSAKEKERR